MSTKTNIEQELAPKKVKVKKMLPAVVLGATFYYSSIFAAGLIIGYLATKLYCHKLGIDEESGDKIMLDVGKWTVHLHHWIMGIMFIIFISLAGWSHSIPLLLWGMLFGMMLQDIYDYSDWLEIVMKKETVKAK